MKHIGLISQISTLIALVLTVLTLVLVEPPRVEKAIINDSSQYSYDFESVLKSFPSLNAGGPGTCNFQNCKIPAHVREEMEKENCRRGVLLTRIWLEPNDSTEIRPSGSVASIDSADSHVLMARLENLTPITCNHTFHLATNDFSHAPKNTLIHSEVLGRETRDIRVWLVRPLRLGNLTIMSGQSKYRNIHQENLVLRVKATRNDQDVYEIEEQSRNYTLFKDILTSGVIPALISAFVSITIFRYDRKTSPK